MTILHKAEHMLNILYVHFGEIYNFFYSFFVDLICAQQMIMNLEFKRSYKFCLGDHLLLLPVNWALWLCTEDYLTMPFLTKM